MNLRVNFVLLLLPLIAACTPADQEYCNGFGVGGTAEYGKCLDYFHVQQGAFDADRRVCSAKADETYPQSLYDHGHTEQVFASPMYFGTPYYGSQIIDVSPDYAKNAEVDRLRLRIIGPCMDARGWNSPTDWQAGRHAVTPVRKAAPSGVHKNTAEGAASQNALPWLNK